MPKESYMEYGMKGMIYNKGGKYCMYARILFIIFVLYNLYNEKI